MHRGQAYRRQGGTASFRPVYWPVLLGVVAAIVRTTATFTVVRVVRGCLGSSRS
jgi:hypothetical protein